MSDYFDYWQKGSSIGGYSDGNGNGGKYWDGNGFGDGNTLGRGYKIGDGYGDGYGRFLALLDDSIRLKYNG
jgi:hypothetical protein